MNGFNLTTGSRLVLAFLVSIFIHLVVLFTPVDERLPVELPLPPLTARLQPLPQPADITQAETSTADPVTTSKQSAPAAVKESTLTPLAKSDVATDPSPLPKHIQLVYAVYSGSDFLKSGEIRNYLDIDQDRYAARSVRNNTGVAGLLKRNRTILTSRGQIVKSGLQPNSFESDDSVAGKKRNRLALFDQAARTLRLFDGSETPFPAEAQDILSFLYQLSQISMHGELFSLPISNGEQLETYRIEIGRGEELDTPMGSLRGLQLRQIHAHNEAHFEIWLGQEYRLLPVKFVRFDDLGNATESWVITDIRASDD
ncbi:MAG: DUF3108 domain-containing protein [Gallionella sp.]